MQLPCQGPGINILQGRIYLGEVLGRVRHIDDGLDALGAADVGFDALKGDALQLAQRAADVQDVPACGARFMLLVRG